MKTFKFFSESETHETINIEVLGKDSTWRKVEGGIPNRSQSISRALDMTKKRYPDSRIKAVGSKSGKTYDQIM
jgi:hypothetical protein